MRPPWPMGLLVALSSVLVMLAGCTGPGKASEEGATDVPVVTDPLDYSYLQNATPGSHIHDYWQGRDRVPVLDKEIGPFSASCSGGCTDGMQFMSMVPDDGVIVPQGTRWLNGSLDVQADGENTWTRIELWVRTAQDNEAWAWGNVTPGTPFSIESTNEQDDPPHYVLSLWEFSLRAYSGGGDVRVAGTIQFKLEAVRGLPLVPYPPHPDQWNGATELDLLEDTQASMYTLYQESPTGGYSVNCSGGCPATHRLGDGVVVPFDARSIEVRITYGPGLPTGLGLSYHGSDTRSLTRVEGTTESPGVTLYTITPAPGETDSPYAKQSLWEFDVWLEYPQDPPVQAWSGEYTITVKASKG